MANPALFPVIQFFDNAGNPLAGGFVYAYLPGTSTPTDLFQDAGLTLKHSYPITLDAYGVPPAPIWCSGETLLSFKTSAGVAINLTYDNFNKAASGLGGYSTKNSRVSTKSTTYSLTSGDDGSLLVLTSGTWTLGTADTAANLGNGYFVDIINTGSGVITFDPNASEVVDYGSGGSTTLLIPPQAHLRLTCDGSQWYAEFANRAIVPGRNRVINGDVRLDQRNGGTAVTVNGTSTFYGPDMWRGTGQAADGVFTLQRNTATPPANFTSYLTVTATTADAAIGATQVYAAFVPFEGANMQDLGFGTASAKLVTLSFWVRSSLTGAFSGSLRNGATNRSFPFSFTIANAATWQQVVVNIPGDTAGTWPTDNTLWGTVSFDLGCGTSERGTAGAWSASNLFGVTSAVSLIGTLNATLDITGLQFEDGGFATPFEQIGIVALLQRCARYYQRYVNGDTWDRQTGPYAQLYSSYASGAAVTLDSFFSLMVAMRATPSAQRIGSWSLGNCSQPTVTGENPLCFLVTSSASAAGSCSASPGAATGYDLTAEL